MVLLLYRYRNHNNRLSIEIGELYVSHMRLLSHIVLLKQKGVVFIDWITITIIHFNGVSVYWHYLFIFFSILFSYACGNEPEAIVGRQQLLHHQGCDVRDSNLRDGRWIAVHLLNRLGHDIKNIKPTEIRIGLRFKSCLPLHSGPLFFFCTRHIRVFIIKESYSIVYGNNPTGMNPQSGSKSFKKNGATGRLLSRLPDSNQRPQNIIELYAILHVRALPTELRRRFSEDWFKSGPQGFGPTRFAAPLCFGVGFGKDAI